MPTPTYVSDDNSIHVYIDDRRQPDAQWADFAFISHAKRAPLNQRVFKDYVMSGEHVVLN